MKQIKLIIFMLIAQFAMAQNDNQKVILITIDGLRWQELFNGADPHLITNQDYVNDTTDLKNRFWRETPKHRREVLFPFIWNEIQNLGQIHGNRAKGSKVNLTNKMLFSFPGYNEILSGKADDKRINSNNKIPNPNTTILEIINKNQRYKGKVSAFGSWDVFPFIINEKRSGVPINAGFDLAEGDALTEREKFLNELQPIIPSPWATVRLDAFTHHYALEEIKKNHPSFVYIAYGETDDFAHDGEYDSYLKSANVTDSFLEELWYYTQNDAFYKDQTMFIITTDHGRGAQPINTWKSHGKAIEGSDNVWFIVFGNEVKPKGEIEIKEQSYSNQIAPTLLRVLNIKIPKSLKMGRPLNLK